jgi:hypothetical protein
MITIKIDLNLERLKQIERETPGKVDKILGKIVLDAEADVKQSFSAESPSTPGGPPGIVSGNLKNNIQGRRIKPGLWALIAGTEYAAPLEFGVPGNNLAPRPFLYPAAKRAFKRLPKELQAIVK